MYTHAWTSFILTLRKAADKPICWFTPQRLPGLIKMCFDTKKSVVPVIMLIRVIFHSTARQAFSAVVKNHKENTSGGKREFENNAPGGAETQSVTDFFPLSGHSRLLFQERGQVVKQIRS